MIDWLSALQELVPPPRHAWVARVAQIFGLT